MAIRDHLDAGDRAELDRRIGRERLATRAVQVAVGLFCVIGGARALLDAGDPQWSSAFVVVGGLVMLAGVARSTRAAVVRPRPLTSEQRDALQPLLERSGRLAAVQQLREWTGATYAEATRDIDAAFPPPPETAATARQLVSAFAVRFWHHFPVAALALAVAFLGGLAIDSVLPTPTALALGAVAGVALFRARLEFRPEQHGLLFDGSECTAWWGGAAHPLAVGALRATVRRFGPLGFVVVGDGSGTVVPIGATIHLGHKSLLRLRWREVGHRDWHTVEWAWGEERFVDLLARIGSSAATG